MIPVPLRKNQRLRVPDGVRIYAIGDIHGRSDLLDRLLERIDADLCANPVPHSIEVFLGDYIDRGPTSKEVIDRLMTRKHAHQMVFLKGNHETYMTEFATNPRILEEWQRLGGLETLMSYGIIPSINANAASQLQLATAFERALPESHRLFLNDLKSSYECGDFFFAHAGIRPGIPLAKQREEDLLWIRWEFLNCEDDFGKIVVHGHTPVAQPDFRANRINIDTGAYATGRLTCLVLEGDEMHII